MIVNTLKLLIYVEIDLLTLPCKQRFVGQRSSMRNKSVLTRSFLVLMIEIGVYSIVPGVIL